MWGLYHIEDFFKLLASALKWGNSYRTYYGRLTIQKWIFWNPLIKMKKNALNFDPLDFLIA